MLHLFISDGNISGISLLIVVVISIALWFVLIRAAVRADRLANNTTELINQQRATNWFMIKLCEKQGVSQEDIDNIKKTFNVK